MGAQNLEQPIRGARDLYPDDLAIRKWLFDSWRDVANSFGYQEIDGPLLESFELYELKSGDELVNRQMYILEDKDGRKLGVRPELTPTFSRMVAKKQGQLAYPLRWMMFGNAWRYEKPQKGRVRDFWQWELNIVGGATPTYDAEVIAIAAKAMQAVNLTPEDVVLRINDRRIMNRVYEKIGINKPIRKDVSSAIDKIERTSPAEFEESLISLGLSKDQVSQLQNFLNAPQIEDFPEITSLFELLSGYGVSDYVKFDPVIVRGLDYYTGTVFECFDRSLEFRSVFGGGRFDDLVETFGGQKVGAVGFAVGDVVIIELLKKLNRLPHLKLNAKALVTVFDENHLDNSVATATKLRQAGIKTELYPEAAKIDKQLAYANKKNIPWVLIIGPQEAENNAVAVKNMETGEQLTQSVDDAISQITS